MNGDDEETNEARCYFLRKKVRIVCILSVKLGHNLTYSHFILSQCDFRIAVLALFRKPPQEQSKVYLFLTYDADNVKSYSAVSLPGSVVYKHYANPKLR